MRDSGHDREGEQSYLQNQKPLRTHAEYCMQSKAWLENAWL